jgi:hypothetical protein
MTRSIAVALFALLLISAPTMAWEKDIHYVMTRYLAEQAGFSPAAAIVIAEADQSLDDRFDAAAIPLMVWVELTGSLATSKLVQRNHFPADTPPPSPPTQRAVDPDGPAARRWAQAKIDDGNADLKGFGEALHPFQDSWSHQGIPDVPLRPGPGLVADRSFSHPQSRGGWSHHDADIMSKHPAEVAVVAKATLGMLCKFLRNHRAFGTPNAACTPDIMALGGSEPERMQTPPSWVRRASSDLRSDETFQTVAWRFTFRRRKRVVKPEVKPAETPAEQGQSSPHPGETTGVPGETPGHPGQNPGALDVTTTHPAPTPGKPGPNLGWTAGTLEPIPLDPGGIGPAIRTLASDTKVEKERWLGAHEYPAGIASILTVRGAGAPVMQVTAGRPRPSMSPAAPGALIETAQAFCDDWFQRKSPVGAAEWVDLTALRQQFVGLDGAFSEVSDQGEEVRREWTRKFLAMYLVSDHAAVNEAGHGDPVDDPKAKRSMRYADLPTTTPDGAFRFRETIRPPALTPDTFVTMDGKTYSLVLNFDQLPHDAAVIQWRQNGERWRVVGMMAFVD